MERTIEQVKGWALEPLINPKFRIDLPITFKRCTLISMPSLRAPLVFHSGRRFSLLRPSLLTSPLVALASYAPGCPYPQAGSLV